MSQRPASVYGGMIPTKNRRGFMSGKLDYYSARFVDYAAECEGEVLDMGCAFGVATLAALERGARVLACDMEAEHLRILAEDAPDESRDRLRTAVGLLPDADFPKRSFEAVLCARVIHFLRPEEVPVVLVKMHGWIKPGGRLFLIADTPYTGFWSAIVPDYEARKAAGDEWPAFIDDISALLPSGQVPDGMLAYLNPMDPDMLARECLRAGFVVEESAFTGREGETAGRHHAGVIAVRPLRR